MTIQPLREIDVSSTPSSRGIQRTGIEGKTVVVAYNELPIRFQINQESWLTTVEGFKINAEQIIKDKETVDSTILCLSRIWFKIVGLDNAVDKREYVNSLKKEPNRTEQIINVTEIESKIPDKNYVEFIIGIVRNTVKQEDSVIRQILYTGMTSYTIEPVNPGISAPTSKVSKKRDIEKGVKIEEESSNGYFKDEFFLCLTKVPAKITSNKVEGLFKCGGLFVSNKKYYIQAIEKMYRIPLTEQHPKSKEEAVPFIINLSDLSPTVKSQLKQYCELHNKRQVTLLLKQVVIRLFENLDYDYAHMSVMKKLRIAIEP